MTRNLKALGLALLAVSSMGAMTASSASAVTDIMTVDNGTQATVTAISHDHVFTTAGTKFECTTAKFTSTVVDGGSTFTVTASYEGTTNVVPHTTHCAGIFGTLTIDMNGCDYKLTGHTDADHSPEVDSHGRIWIECPVNQEIVMTNSTCTIRVPAQTPTEGGFTYTNQLDGTIWDVQAEITVTGITYTATHSFACTLAGLKPEGNDATYSGNTDRLRRQRYPST